MLSVERSDEPTQRQALYKTKGSFLSQEEKRKQFLEELKRKRTSTFDAGRNLPVLSEEQPLEELEEFNQSDSLAQERLSKKKFGKMLMRSEWLEEVPEDLTENWICVPCPVGKRCIVISEKSTCRAYSLNGKFLFQSKALLKKGNNYNKTILDCIYVKDTNTFHILDVISWAGYSLVNCETEFRFYWLRSKFDETPELLERSRPGACNYRPLDTVPAGDTGSALERLEFKLDGVLFFHKEAHYTSGVSPLVVWLLPFMLPEVLGIAVGKELGQQPEGYPGHLEFIAEEKRLRKRRRGRNSVKMDLSDSFQEEDSIDNCGDEHEEDQLELG